VGKVCRPEPGPGPARGTGTFADREAFLRALARAIRDLERAGRPVTQEAVADRLSLRRARPISSRTFLQRRWAEALANT
jgi:hypothetical protein